MSSRIEDRYTVFKDADLRAAAKAGFISEQDIVDLCRIDVMVAGFRRQQRKPELRYVVFQSNWEVYHDAKKLLQWYIDRPLITFDERFLVKPGDQVL